jgi:hypothetical protein
MDPHTGGQAVAGTISEGFYRGNLDQSFPEARF